MLCLWHICGEVVAEWWRVQKQLQENAVAFDDFADVAWI